MRVGGAQLLVADKKGKIINIPYLEAAGMKAGRFFRLNPRELIKLPKHSELFMLPDRLAAGYDPKKKDFVIFNDKGYRAVAAFISPGFTLTYNSAYKEAKGHAALPLFSYAAAAFHKGKIYAAAIRVDKRHCHDLEFMDISLILKNIKRFKKTFPGNRLITHLKTCALTHSCPNAKNFFLSRYEAPLPVSGSCNARCAGCISYQLSNRPAAQPRINFTPHPGEISELALYHIANTKDPIVSFGQGCEGEPLLKGGVIEKAIRLIRKRTKGGIINMNTNASRPYILSILFDAGLDAIRVSLNSVRENHYARYYKPMGYEFKDVLRSIKIAKRKNRSVSINYLTMPGFTDSRAEFNALKCFIDRFSIDMVQLRNLNFDPLGYFKELKLYVAEPDMLGMEEIIFSLRKIFPRLMIGYFNPSRAMINFAAG